MSIRQRHISGMSVAAMILLIILAVALRANGQCAVNPGTNKAICKGQSIQLGEAAVEGFSYSWTSNPSGFISSSPNPTVSPAVTTVYTLTQNWTLTGCTKIASVTVTVSQLPAANAGSDTSICTSLNRTRLNGKLANASGGQWSGYSGKFLQSDTTLNSYYVPSASEVVLGYAQLILTTIGNGSCSADADTVKINIKMAPNPIISGPTEACENISYSYSTPSNSGSTYHWQAIGGTIKSGRTARSAVVNWGATGPGYLSVTETNASGCSTTSYLGAFSKFDFNNGALAKATVGPDATSVNTDAYSNGEGFIINKNCSRTAGLGLSVPGTVFNHGKIAMVFRFQRDKNEAEFFERGGMKFYVSGGQLFVSYSISNGAGGGTAIGPINTRYTIPKDDIFRNYLFAYDSLSGKAVICSDTSVVWTNTSTAGRSLYWKGAGDAKIGEIMDGNCTSNPMLDYAVAGKPVSLHLLPNANVYSNATICAGESVALGAAAVSGRTYVWTSSPLGFAAISANPIVSPAVTTTYTVTETITATGCATSNSVTVSVNPLPAANVGSASAVGVGQKINIGAIPAAGRTFAWTSSPAGFISSSANPMVAPVITTTYSLTETITATGCKNTNSITVTVNK